MSVPAPALQDQLRGTNEIEINQIVVGNIALRPAQMDTEEFKGLMASIEATGILQPLLVRQYDKDAAKVLLVDGLQRYTIAKALGFETVPVHFATLDEQQMMAAQIAANVQRVKQKPAQVGQQFRRMMALNSLLTVPALAKSVGMSTQYVAQRISLFTLCNKAAELVDNGDISASYAFALAKLPKDEQEKWLEEAVSNTDAKVFLERIYARVRELKQAAATGSAAKEEAFVSVKRLRSPNIVKDELETHANRNRLVTADMDARDAFDLAVAWVLHQDPITVAEEQAAWESAKAAKKAHDEERKAAKEAEKAAKEAKKQEEQDMAGQAAADAAAAALAAEVAGAEESSVEETPIEA